MVACTDSSPSFDCSIPDNFVVLLALVMGEQFAEAALTY